MGVNPSFRLFLLAALPALFLGCGQPHSKDEVESAMKRYDSFIKTVNVDSMTQMYTPDGNLGDIARGQDSIRRFLTSFNSYTVLSMASTTSSIELKGDSSTQKGTYKQTVMLTPQDTVRIKGTYTANWQWTPATGWRIKRMTTKPIK